MKIACNFFEQKKKRVHLMNSILNYGRLIETVKNER